MPPPSIFLPSYGSAQQFWLFGFLKWKLKAQKSLLADGSPFWLPKKLIVLSQTKNEVSKENAKLIG